MNGLTLLVLLLNDLSTGDIGGAYQWQFTTGRWWCNLKYGATIYRFGWRGQVSTLAAMRPIGVSNSYQYPTALPRNRNRDNSIAMSNGNPKVLKYSSW